MKRDSTLDYLRGLAILSIVIGHLYFYSGRDDGSIVWNICNTIQIPIIIYVSGQLASKSILKYNFTEFLKKRITRLIIPFISIFIIWMILHNITLENATTFITDEFKRGFWFLGVLFELMIILATNQLISQKLYIHRVFGDFFVLIIINIYHFTAWDFDNFNQILSLNLLWHYYPIFLLGIYSKQLHWLINIKLSFLYIIIYAVAFYFMYFKNLHLMIAVCNLSSLFIFLTIFNNGYKIAESTIVKIGCYSLEIYLLHVLAFGLLDDIIPIINNRWIEAPLYFLLAYVICFFFIEVSFFIKKSKTANFLLFGG